MEAADFNPQRAQMVHESMLRTLAAQAEAIWPQEQALLARYGLPDDARVLDAGCGTGEFAARVAACMPEASVLGVDLAEELLAVARQRHAALAPRLAFDRGDAYRLEHADGSFDLVACRHMLQAVPHPERVIAELWRLTRPGGVLHLLAEDYGMIHAPAGRLDPDRLWHEGVVRYTGATRTDARIGRNAFGILRALGVESPRVDYVTVDTQRVDRGTFAAIMTAWRDGYADAIAAHTPLAPAEVLALFDEFIGAIRDPDRYVAWQVPIVSAVRPG